MPYATRSAGLAITVRGSSRRIMIMRFRPANIRLINRRSNLPRLLLALSSGKENPSHQNPTDFAQLTPSLHIRATRSLKSLMCQLNIRTDKRYAHHLTCELSATPSAHTVRVAGGLAWGSCCDAFSHSAAVIVIEMISPSASLPSGTGRQPFMKSSSVVVDDLSLAVSIFDLLLLLGQW